MKLFRTMHLFIFMTRPNIGNSRNETNTDKSKAFWYGMCFYFKSLFNIFDSSKNEEKKAEKDGPSGKKWVSN